MKKILVILTVATGLIGISFTGINNQDKKPWPVPDSSKNMKNPVASNAESIAEEKRYMQRIASRATVQKVWVMAQKQPS